MNRMHALLITLYLGAETHLRARDEKGSVTTSAGSETPVSFATRSLSSSVARGVMRSTMVVTKLTFWSIHFFSSGSTYWVASWR